jgi:hypothetical protein
MIINHVRSFLQNLTNRTSPDLLLGQASRGPTTLSCCKPLTSTSGGKLQSDWNCRLGPSEITAGGRGPSTIGCADGVIKRGMILAASSERRPRPRLGRCRGPPICPAWCSGRHYSKLDSRDRSVALCDCLQTKATWVSARCKRSVTLACAWQRFSTFLVMVCEYTDTIWGPLGEFPFFAEIPRWTAFAGMSASWRPASTPCARLQVPSRRNQWRRKPEGRAASAAMRDTLRAPFV